ncbi:hypothetical protein EMPS_04534 [Entomortierella parvispora]|uniref:Uncharacterized protein n=1 Tax=Entomortierella parvispora TaxID=205924 RepID=A0A9P3H8U1_9FUNG|nr:hypothetical protein EMPS_04534 [Entomortierella parvispora]
MPNKTQDKPESHCYGISIGDNFCIGISVTPSKRAVTPEASAAPPPPEYSLIDTDENTSVASRLESGTYKD